MRRLLALLIALCLASPSWAALSANTVWEVRTTGSDTNGGGFVDGASGTDWSVYDSPQYSVTDGVTNGTTTITSATANFGTDVVGNIIYVQGGTGSVVASWYQITSRTNSTTIVVDRSTGLSSGTGVTLKIGGALATPVQAKACYVLSNGHNKVWIKAGTYTLSTALALFHTDSAPVACKMIGYNSTRGDTPGVGNQPVIELTASGASITAGGAGTRLYNLTIDGTDTATTGLWAGPYANRGTAVINCIVKRCATYGISGDMTAINCAVTDMKAGATSAFYGVTNCFNCVAYDNPCTGFGWANNGGPGICVACISYNNTGSTSDGFGGGNTLQGHNHLDRCIAYGNGRNGFYFPTYYACSLRNSIAYGNGVSTSGYGLNIGGDGGKKVATRSFDYNAYGNNTSSNYSGIVPGDNDVSLGSDPFTNAAAGDFSLDASGLTDLKAQGDPGVFPGGLSTGYLDIGAVQHQDSGGSSGSSPFSIGIGN